MTEKAYLIACRTPWFWDEWAGQEPAGRWEAIREPSELTVAFLEELQPRFVFFPHWSHKVPAEIFERWECVCFHATPLPYGRGGSPVQNMISEGHENTALTALRMTREIDAGPVYLQRQMSLLGGGDEIFIRLSREIRKAINYMIENEPVATPQVGEPHTFRRRTPHDSELSEVADLKSLFDFIRMLDAEGYPRAFFHHGRMTLQFSRPALRRGRVEADVSITLASDETTEEV